MYPLRIFLIALWVASHVPDRVQATDVDPSVVQHLPVGKKVDAICDVVGLLSIKAALLAARTDTEAAFENGAEDGEARVTYREEPSASDEDFLKAIDCHLGLVSPHLCETVIHAETSGEDAPAETTSDSHSPALVASATLADTRPAPEDGGTKSRGPVRGSLDVNAAWTVSALQPGGENWLSDPEILTHMGRKAAEVAREFFKVAAGGRLLEPSSSVLIGEFDEEKLGEAVRLAGKFLGSLQLSLSPQSLEIKTQTHHDTVRRLTTKEIGAFVSAHKACNPKGDILKKCDLESRVKNFYELKGKLSSEVKGKCDSNSGGKCGSKGKKKCAKHCASASEQNPTVEPALITTSAILPFSSPSSPAVQPQVVPHASNLPVGTQVMYGLNNVATAAAYAAGAAVAPLYQDGLWLLPIPQPADGGSYQLNGGGMSQIVYPYSTNELSQGLYLLGSNGPAPAWRSSEYSQRVLTPIRSPILQEISPLLLSPIAAMNAQLQRSSLLSPLYRSALGKFFLDHKDAVHYDELQNFKMTTADLL